MGSLAQVQDDTFMFPKYLNKGSRGPAVVLLQILLVAMGHNRGKIHVDGDYGEQTAVGVKSLQQEMGIPEGECDGNFGPRTRSVFLTKTGIGVDIITSDLFVGRTEGVGP